MMTLEEALKALAGEPDRSALEIYVKHAWVKPVVREEVWHFETVDIARVQLVHHLKRDMLVNDEGMDIVLNLLDQLYSYREHMRKVREALKRQPASVQSEILALLREFENE